MADALPSEYDAIVLGTGLPEAVVAAALSRIGYKVLHLDRNDYYSGYWASFSFDNLQKWIETNTSQETQSTDRCKDHVEEVSDPSIKTTEKQMLLPLHGNAITNIEVQSFFRSKIHVETGEVDAEDASMKKNEVRGDMATLSSEVTSIVETDETKDVTAGEIAQQYPANCLTAEKKGRDGEPCQETVQAAADPETSPESKAATASPAVSNVVNWAERRKLKKEIKLGRDATLENLSEQSRKFNLDLAPKLLFARGSLVESLIGANIAHYAEFKVVSRILTYLDGNIEEVPCSRSDVFGSELIKVLEKRALMRFMTFCANFQDSPEEYVDFQDKPFVDFLKARKLTTNLQHIITHAIAVVSENATTLCGLKATQKFLQSLGRYGNTPFLWSLYGSGELPQAFCRMCAVFGGIYCLRKTIKCLVYNEESKKCVGVISSDGQRLNTRWLIMEKSYAPEVFQIEPQDMISRAILITDKSLKPSSREHVTLLTLPGKSQGTPVRVVELAPSSMACPESLYVVHFIVEASSTAKEDLQSYVKQLFTTVDEGDSGKPAVLWAMYFNRKCFMENESAQIPENVKLTSLPSSQLDFEDAMKEAKSIFSSICPDEEFLAAVPNPEDIIWDDFMNNPDIEQETAGEQSAGGSEAESGEQSSTADHDCTDQDATKEHTDTSADRLPENADQTLSSGHGNSDPTVLTDDASNLVGSVPETTSGDVDAGDGLSSYKEEK